MSDATPPKRARVWPRVVAVSALPVVLLALAQVAPVLEWMDAAFAWTAGQGAVGFLVFTLIFTAVCLSTVPEVYPNLAAGMIWGPVLGGLATSVARVVACAVTFVLVRGVLRERVAEAISGDRRWRAVDTLLAREGFKFVVLLRLCPIFPANLLNFGLGVTGVGLWPYLAGTFVGMLPRSLVIAYAGAGSRSLADLVSGGVSATDMVPGPAIWAGLAAMGIAIVWLGLMARRMVNAAMAAEEAA